MTYDIGKINALTASAPEELVRQADEAYFERVRAAADAIRRNLARCPIVLLSGPSGAGKTTTARNIETELERQGINSHTISMDNYFNTLDQRTCPRTPEGDIDFESPRLMDMDLLNEHFAMLAEGREIRVPYFMFTRQKRSVSQFTPMRLGKNEVAIFEGIHALNDEITDRNPGAFKLYISASSQIDFPGGKVFRPEWIRLVRRVVRDNNFRGADADYTLSMWANVMRGERQHITPFIPKADMSFDTTLAYEMSVLAPQALPLFEKLTEGRPAFEEVREILPLLRGITGLDEKYVPATSLLREFIGGGVYSY